MGRVIQGTQMEKTPIVLLKEKEGSTFVGTRVRQKPGKKPGQYIFEFKVEGGETFIGLSTGKKVVKNGKPCNEYASVDVNVGDKVSIFGDTQLNDKLSQVADGEKVKVTFNGFKLNDNTGNAYADYTVEVL